MGRRCRQLECDIESFLRRINGFDVRAQKVRNVESCDDSASSPVVTIPTEKRTIIAQLNRILSAMQAEQDGEVARMRRAFNLLCIHGQLLIDANREGVWILGAPTIGKTTITILMLTKFKDFKIVVDDEMLLAVIDGDIYAGPLSMKKGFILEPRSGCPFAVSAEQTLKSFVKVNTILNLMLDPTTTALRLGRRKHVDSTDVRKMISDVVINFPTTYLKLSDEISTEGLRVWDVIFPRGEDRLRGFNDVALDAIFSFQHHSCSVAKGPASSPVDNGIGEGEAAMPSGERPAGRWDPSWPTPTESEIALAKEIVAMAERKVGSILEFF